MIVLEREVFESLVSVGSVGIGKIGEEVEIWLREKIRWRCCKFGLGVFMFVNLVEGWLSYVVLDRVVGFSWRCLFKDLRISWLGGSKDLLRRNKWIVFLWMEFC